MLRAVVVLVALAGCSFMAMRSPRGTPPECEESRTAPTIDTVVAIAAPILTYAILAGQNSDPPKFGEAPSFEIVASLVLTTPVIAVMGTSAVYGFIKADRCERAKRDYQQLINAPPLPGPPPIGPPPPVAPTSAPPEGGRS